MLISLTANTIADESMVRTKVKMFNQMASMTERVKEEKLQKRLDYERRRSVFEKTSRTWN